MDRLDKLIKSSTIKLSREDSQAFVYALLDSSEPSERMKAAASEYKRIMGIKAKLSKKESEEGLDGYSNI